jgi:hypothetical protein
MAGGFSAASVEEAVRRRAASAGKRVFTSRISIFGLQGSSTMVQREKMNTPRQPTKGSMGHSVISDIFE